jgi:hypothetical protein
MSTLEKNEKNTPFKILNAFKNHNLQKQLEITKKEIISEDNDERNSSAGKLKF